MNTTTCTNPDCTNPVESSGRPGRPTIYCTPACRPSHKTRPPRRQPGLTVEITDTTTQNGRRNQHSWTVTLRRGTHTVTIAHDLGRFTATALADDIQQLIAPDTTVG